MYTKSLIAKIALCLSVFALVAFSMGALAQPTQVIITAPASDGTVVAPGTSVTFTGSATEPSGLALTYTWNFSDGTSQTGQSISYPITSNATLGSTITATLTVTDSNNVTGDTQPTRSVTVVAALAQPTQVNITAPASDGSTAARGNVVTFSGTAIETDSNALPLTYTWVFSDGSSQSGQSVNYTVPANATVGSTVTATLKVINSTNVSGDTQPTRSVTVSASTTTPGASSLVYVANYFANTVTLIDPASNNVVTTLAVNGYPYGQDISQDGKYAYVIYPKDGTPVGTVSVIDPNSHTVTATATITNGSNGQAVTPAGTFAYSTNFNYYGTVSVTDKTTDLVTATIKVGAYPTGIAITPDGTSAYVANYLDGTVSVINTAGNAVTKTIPVVAFPYRVGNVLTTSTTTPFSAFSVQNLTVAPAFGALSLSSTFTLGDTSVGIAPSLQTTLLNIGNYYTLAIPPGGFKLDAWGAYHLTGEFQGFYVAGLIQPLGGKQYSLEIYAHYGNLIWIISPVTVKLSIGGIQTTAGGQAFVGDTGSTTANVTLLP